MPDVVEADLRAALQSITAAGETQSVLATDRVQGLVIRDGHVGFSLEVDGLDPEAVTPLKDAAEAAIHKVAGVVSVTCVLTAHRSGGQAARSAEPGLHGSARTDTPEVFGRIKKVIAVASGKGGVGKSTVAINLAVALAAAGHTTGLLDADIHGPSAPQLLAISGRPDADADKKLIPIEAHGVLTMSIGYMVPPEQAMIWRGPMAQSAFIQMLEEVRWPSLDVLVIDLPPGTGDIQLSMAQRLPVDGALIVTTPSALALADVKRAAAMFAKTDIPVLGLIENMAYLDAPDGSRLYPFGEGGAAMAETLNLPNLAALPLDPTLQAANESGTPPGAGYAAFAALAKRILTAMEAQT